MPPVRSVIDIKNPPMLRHKESSPLWRSIVGFLISISGKELETSQRSCFCNTQTNSIRTRRRAPQKQNQFLGLRDGLDGRRRGGGAGDGSRRGHRARQNGGGGVQRAASEPRCADPSLATPSTTRTAHDRCRAGTTSVPRRGSGRASEAHSPTPTPPLSHQASSRKTARWMR